jgi:hypothetical protein
MTKANIEHSVHLHSPVYGLITDEFVPRIREFATRGGKVYFVPPDLTLNPFFFGLYDDDYLFPVSESTQRGNYWKLSTSEVIDVVFVNRFVMMD